MEAEPESQAGADAPGSAEARKKRNRIRLSCTTCREKKLKCDRGWPCDQCEKRGLTATCNFVPYQVPKTTGGRAGGGDSIGGSTVVGRHPRGGQAGPPTHDGYRDPALQNRLRHLEHVVQVLKAQKDHAGGGAAGGASVPLVLPLNPEAGSRQASSVAEQVVDPALRGPEDERGDEAESSTAGQPPPPTQPEGASTAGALFEDHRYVDSANWEAILDDVIKLTHELVMPDNLSDDEGEADTSLANRDGPVLLLGTFPQATVAEIIQLFPPRRTTDSLIARFFEGKEPAWMIFHVPTFLKQYAEFWDNPTKASYTWVSLLFSMIAHAAFFSINAGRDVPGNLGNAQYVFDTYRIRCAQCLALDDYTKPGKHKVEALTLYFGLEYLRVTDAGMGCSILMSIMTRLGMHMGLQRDPKHYPGLYFFEAEMRRRLWGLLVEIDLLVSFQFGLPPNIFPRFYDTPPPLNLMDEDFDESTVDAPASRPETERTPVLYSIAKNRIIVAFGEIVSSINSSAPASYAEVMRLDRQLEAAHDAIPPVLRMRTFSQSVTDAVDVIMQRYWLELLYQKARCVLHRKYLGLARREPRYAYSRWTCICAAMKTLLHQYDVHVELQPGGRLSRERWFLSSLGAHDFLLADLILCLELSYLLRSDGDAMGDVPVVIAQKPETQIQITKDQLLDILRTSRLIWQSHRTDWAQAGRAFKILSRMLSLSTGADYSSSPDSTTAPFPPSTSTVGHGAGSASTTTLGSVEPPDYLVGMPKPSFQFPAPQAGVDLRALALSMAAPGTSSTRGPVASRSISPPSSWHGAAAEAAWERDNAVLGGGPDFNLTGAGAGVDDAAMSALAVSQSAVGDVDPIMNFEWSIWDTQVQNANMPIEVSEFPWGQVFPTSLGRGAGA